MTDRPAKAEGMNWVNPYLVLRNLQEAIDFYEDVFGFKTNMILPDKDGNPMHAEMHYRDCVIMMGAEDKNSKSPGSLHGSPVGFYLYVDDVDAFYKRVRESAAEVTDEPRTQFWGDRTFSARCPEGHLWTFAQNVADFDPDNAPQ